MAVPFYGPQGQEVGNEDNEDRLEPDFTMGMAVYRTVSEAMVSG